ncbi:MarR family transcriptional regulator [Rhodobacteraceae bacterium NNCM2]|nr:MarR family transcriptional regulator [Coraliihabitans acroporae]
MFFLKELPTEAMLNGYAARFPQMEPALMADALARLRWASLLIREIEAYFAGHGLSQTQFLILMVIDREPEADSLQPSEIADRLDISRPIISNAIRRLRAAGSLEEAEAGGDNRARPIRLTGSGMARLDAVLPGYFRLVHDFQRAHPAPAAQAGGSP